MASYQHTRDLVFEAATVSAAKGVPVTGAGRLVSRTDAERAFAEWQSEGGSGVTMRLTETANGDIATEFLPPSAA